MMYTTFVSTEPLEIIRRNECDYHEGSLATQRFRALWNEIERLRRDCAEAYQVIGAGMLGEVCAYSQQDVERALDNLTAASNGDIRKHDDLLPWPHQNADA